MHNSGWWAYISYDPSRGKPSVDRALLRRVLAWAQPYYGRFAAMLALLLVIALIELVPPLLYGDLVNHLSQGTLDLARLNLLALGLFGVPLASSLLGVAQRYLSSQIGEGVIFDLRRAMYAHMQRMSLRFFTETKVGDIISRFSNDVVGAQGAVTNTLPNLIANVLTLATTLAVMLSLEPRLTLLAVVALPLFLLPTRRVGGILREIRREGAGYDARMSTAIQETLNVSGALLVRTFGRGGDELARFEDAAGSVRDIGVRRAVVGRWFFFGLGIAGAIGTALMYWAGGYLALDDKIEVGTIVAFAAYASRLYGPISALSNIQVEFATSLVSFERVFEYLDLAVEIDERPGATRLEAVRGDVAFDDVWFSYRHAPEALGAVSDGAPDAAAAAAAEPSPSGHVSSGHLPAEPVPAGHVSSGHVPGTPVPTLPAAGNGDAPGAPAAPAARGWALEGVDFEVQAGQLAALVGPSGAGKTTVGYLLARLYDPTRGRVLLDGHDLCDLTLGSVADHVGIVTQETFLFHDTIRANLAFARPAAADDEIVAACRLANIHALIASLPEGYDTVVGERGYRLSGGEKQRLALARVILKDPSVLVLDEATSHLDSHSEALIQEALERVMHGRTSLVIAHRLSTILAADVILVFQDGRIVERGRHDALVRLGGLYASLFETQFRDAPAPVRAPAGRAAFAARAKGRYNRPSLYP